MLFLQILWLEILVNGATGVIKDFLFDSDNDSMPFAVVVDFTSYSGPAFFSCVGQEHWVPVLAGTDTWTTYTRGSSVQGDQHFRKQFPLGLAWAWTFHNARSDNKRPYGTKY